MGDVQPGRGGQGIARLQFGAAALIVALAPLASLLPRPAQAVDAWGGSIGLTSDYLVRGISRSNHDPALQADLHYATDAGFIAGMFASQTQLTPYDRRDVEVSALLGFAWQGRGAWGVKALGSYYTYPWNDSGSQYNYAELLIEAGYAEWLEFGIAFSPRARYLPDAGNITSTSTEMTLRTPWWHRLGADAGIGHTRFSGSAGGYTYWSAGGMLDLAPWLLTVAYVTTNEAAQPLFYDAAARNRWVATVLWRF